MTQSPVGAQHAAPQLGKMSNLNSLAFSLRPLRAASAHSALKILDFILNP
jgi:hypothetical protein